MSDSRVGILNWVNYARSNPIVGRANGIFSSAFELSITADPLTKGGQNGKVLTDRNHLT